MNERIVVHVSMDSLTGDWTIRQGSARIATYLRKPDAVEAARKIVNGAEKGELHVHNEDGTTVTEYSSGADPFPAAS